MCTKKPGEFYVIKLCPTWVLLISVLNTRMSAKAFIIYLYYTSSFFPEKDFRCLR